VSPDKEVREGRNFSAAFLSVPEKHFSGEKGGLPGELVFPEEQGIQDPLQILDRGKAYRYLCIDKGRNRVKSLFFTLPRPELANSIIKI
jgi:hypothetical protein